jgi:hypothetical protein
VEPAAFRPDPRCAGIGTDEKQASTADVERLLAATRKAFWQPAQAIGEGEEYRAEFGRDHASALWLQGALVYTSVLAGR